MLEQGLVLVIDFQIYHDGNSSYIRDSGEGSLYIDTNGPKISLISDGSYSNGKMADFVKDGAVTLYHDNSTKLATTATGIDVTGNITLASGSANAAAANGAGLTVDGANATWTYSSGDDAWASNKHAQFYTGGGTGTLSVGRTSDQAIRLYADDNYNRIFAFQDADSDSDHFFDLVRSFQGTGKADMRFMSGTAVHAVLDKAGNFGINTAAPSNKLEVNGIACIISGLRLGSSASGEGLIRHGGTTSYGVGITTGALSSTNIKLFVAHENDGGGVGIGTTAPSDKLHVIGNTKIEQTSNVDAILRLNPNSGTIGSNYRWELVGRNSAENYNFQIRQGSTPYLTINNSIGGGAGSVGIGTTNPTSHINTGSFFKPDSNGKFLTLNGGANGSFIMLESSTTTDNDQIGGIYWNRTQGQGDAHKQVAGIDVIQAAYAPNNTLEGGTLRFFTKGSGSGVNTSRMVINPDGKVGIGKTPSTWHLDVDSPNIYIASFDGSNDKGIVINSMTGEASIVGYSNSANAYNKVNIRGAGGTGLVVDTSNNVGIGTASPNQKLSVTGVISSDANNDYYGAWMNGSSASNQYSTVAVGEWYSVGLYMQKKTGQNYSHIYNYNSSHNLILQGGSGTNGEVSGAGNVGIGTTAPIAPLDVVRGGTTGLTSVNARTALLVQNNLSNGTVLSINAKNTGYSGIFLGDQDSEAICQIQYDHTDNKLKFLTNGGGYNPLTLSGQNVGIGTSFSVSYTTHFRKLRCKVMKIAQRHYR